MSAGSVTLTVMVWDAWRDCASVAVSVIDVRPSGLPCGTMHFCREHVVVGNRVRRDAVVGKRRRR